MMMRLFYVTLILAALDGRNLIHSQTVMATDPKDAVKAAHDGDLDLLASKVEPLDGRIARDSKWDAPMPIAQVIGLIGHPDWRVYAHDRTTKAQARATDDGA